MVDTCCNAGSGAQARTAAVALVDGRLVCAWGRSGRGEAARAGQGGGVRNGRHVHVGFSAEIALGVTVHRASDHASTLYAFTPAHIRCLSLPLHHQTGVRLPDPV